MVAHVFVGDAEMDVAYYEAAKRNEFPMNAWYYSRCLSDVLFEDWMMS